MLSSLKTFIVAAASKEKIYCDRNVHQYLTHSASKVVYKPVPRSGGYMIDNRRDRKIIEDEYKPKKANCKLRFELMDENDIEFMIQIATEHFVRESNLMRHLQIKCEELIERWAPLIAKYILSETSVIIKDGDKIVGTGFGNVHDRKDFDRIFRGQLFHDNPKFVIKDDYAEDINNGPYKSRNFNRVVVLFDELEWQTGKFLPKNTEKIGCSELISVDPNYMRLNLASKIALVNRELFQSKGCTHEHAIPVATGTWKAGQKLGHRTLFSLPYNQFLDNGKPVFENLHDNAIAAHSTLMDYKIDKIHESMLEKI
uniref:Uncharacterized protein n=1 Tax=Panagrolaimus superbus TaxID=310955 RepID=A0A914YYR1_9BILA